MTGVQTCALPISELAWGFQDSVVDVLVTKTIRAARAVGAASIVLGGGVAANGPLRTRLAGEAEALGVPLTVPRPGLCTDNGAMVAALGSELVARGATPSSLNLPADSSMPVTDVLAR